MNVILIEKKFLQGSKKMLWKENVISKENLNESKTFCNEVILAKCFISLSPENVIYSSPYIGVN